jgi:hypothetical protein
VDASEIRGLMLTPSVDGLELGAERADGDGLAAVVSTTANHSSPRRAANKWHLPTTKRASHSLPYPLSAKQSAEMTTMRFKADQGNDVRFTIYWA